MFQVSGGVFSIIVVVAFAPAMIGGCWWCC